MRTFPSLESLHEAVGEHLGYSSWQQITQSRVDAFAEATDDHQWIHTDPVAAAQGPFGGTVAHGYLTLSLISALTSEVYRVSGVRFGVNYGLNRVRFPAPVPVGSRIRAGVSLTSFDEIEGGAHVVFETVIEAEGGGKPCCVAEPVIRFYY